MNARKRNNRIIIVIIVILGIVYFTNKQNLVIFFNKDLAITSQIEQSDEN